MTLRSLTALLALIAAVAAVPRPAAAQQIAYAVPGTTNVRAGPGTQYPVITQVYGGERVDVYGCLSDYSWCDIFAHGIRGWMYAPRLQFVYGGSYVRVPEYYRYFGAPIIRFDFGYWDRWYSDYPWYRRWRRDDPNSRPPGFDDDGVTNYPGIEGPASGGGFQPPRVFRGGPSGGEAPPAAPGRGRGGGGGNGGAAVGGSPGVSGGGGRCPIWNPNC
jgi:uncharacterized protein YraI